MGPVTTGKSERFPATHNQPQAAVRQPRLLIVDDDPRVLRIFRRILSQADRQCLAFERASDVLAALRSNPGVDVVLSDLRMPQTDGIELIRQVRAEFSERRWLQFILVTGQASIDTAISALRLEAVDYLFKPVMPKELLSSVRNAMHKTQLMREMLAGRDDAAGSGHLAALARTARALAAELSRISRSAPEPIGAALGIAQLCGPGTKRASVSYHAQEYESLRLLMGLQEARSSLFGDALLPDPAWEMLAELMLARLTGRRVAVTSLCLASKTPVTTALRRIDDLIEAGLAMRMRDSTDRRRSYIELTEQGCQKMQRYLIAVVEKFDLSS